MGEAGAFRACGVGPGREIEGFYWENGHCYLCQEFGFIHNLSDFPLCAVQYVPMVKREVGNRSPKSPRLKNVVF